MPTLPIGFFMPLPLPVMIPFMMWQSAAIAAGFGTYFQFAKRRVSAMSNEEFNKADPHKLVESLYADIVDGMPSSFKQIDSMTPIILDSMLKMLTDAVKWFSGILGGQLDSPFKFGDPIQPIEPILPEPPIELLSLTLSQISALNDLALQSKLNNPQDYNAQTNKWIIDEINRRKNAEKPQIEPPTPQQESTKLDVEFVGSLSRQDLEIGGSRVRNYKGKIQKWIGTNKITYPDAAHRLVNMVWENGWSLVGAIPLNTLNDALARVNNIKIQQKSAYVLEFKIGNKYTWYLIKDNF